MQVFRTILWIIVTAVLVAFVAMNWTHVPVNFWPLDNGNYAHFEWPVGIVAILFFLLGFMPMWLLNRAGRWRLKRRISSLENSVRAVSVPRPAGTASSEIPADAAQPEPTPESKF
jgi:lipopolysaccharide assembly protein A